jgi:hypothetical protein
MTKLLIASSFIFLSNSMVTLYFNYYNYSLFFLGLHFSSILFHYHTTIYTNLFDKIFIVGIVYHGGELLYKKTNQENQLYVGCITSSFLITIFLFYYGYCTNNYCYHPDKRIGDNYHCAVHIITSLGHHMITFL